MSPKRNFLSLWIFLFFVPGVFAVTVSTSSQLVIDDGIRVLASEFDGSTTDFLSMSDEELASIYNLTIEMSSFGKVVFNGPINLTKDSVSSVIDLDSNFEIGFNSILTNRSLLSSLTGTATIYLYNIGINGGVVVKDGSDCGSSCVVINPFGTNFTFTVDEFSHSYGVRQADSGTVTPPSGGGGSTSYRYVEAKSEDSDIFLFNDFLKVDLLAGVQASEKVKITNFGDKETSLEMLFEGLDKYVVLSENIFVISAKETKDLVLYFKADRDATVGVYYGKLHLLDSETNLDYVINIVLEVGNDKSLFDLKVNVDDEYLVGDSVEAVFDIVSLGETDVYELDFDYSITDLDGNVLYTKSESLQASGSLSLNRIIELSNLEKGRYVVVGHISYNGIEDVGFDSFLVVTEKPFEWSFAVREWSVMTWLYILLAVLSILGITYIIVYKIYSDAMYRSYRFFIKYSRRIFR